MASLNDRSRADHPHGRGDGSRISVSAFGPPGSPPRAWGRQKAGGRDGHPERITPTGVGTARAWTSGPCGTPDHPHGRGDGAARYGAASADGGSPPRAWGRLAGSYPTRRRMRITPTGVGTAPYDQPAIPTDPDHPHGRGDGVDRAHRPDHKGGSPPRAWGRLYGLHAVGFNRRITPTGVGTALGSRTYRRSLSDHPHGRGDGFHHRLT